MSQEYHRGGGVCQGSCAVGAGEGVWVTHCADMDGELIRWMEEDAREFSLTKDDSG